MMELRSFSDKIATARELELAYGMLDRRQRTGSLLIDSNVACLASGHGATEMGTRADLT